MLRQRVITALVLLALLLPALFAHSPLPFALFTGVLISAAGWEWARLNGAATAGLAIGSGALLSGQWSRMHAFACAGPGTTSSVNGDPRNGAPLYSIARANLPARSTLYDAMKVPSSCSAATLPEMVVFASS